MGNLILASRNSTNTQLSYSQSPTVPVASAVVVALRDASQAQAPLPLYLDFADSTFKTAGWATRQASMFALGGNQFALDGGLSIAAITNLSVDTRWLVAEYEATIGARLFTDNDPINLRELDTQAHVGTTFQPLAGGTTRFTTWLNRNGTTVLTGLISCVVDFFTPAGVLLFTETVLVADAQGHFDVTHVGDLLTAGNPFYLIITITDAEGVQFTHRTNPFT